MAEFTANTLQTVETNQNILFADVPIPGSSSILHREGSGLVTLRGISNGQCRARFRATFSGNIAVPDGGTAGPISIAMALNGEAVGTTTAIVTPAATGDFFNVASIVFIDIPIGCCSQLSIKNTSGQTIDVQNANLIVERVA